MSRCACGRPTLEPGRLCGGCEKRRTPPARTPPARTPPAPRAPGFVLAPPVAPSPPRRCDPMPPADITPRVAHTTVCVVPFCGGVVRVAKHGSPRSPEYAGRCESCCNAVRWKRRLVASLRRHGVAA